MNRVVSVSKRVETDKGLRYCPVVESKNGRIKSDYVWVDGKEQYHSEGAYYISWYEGKKLNRLSVGKDAATAYARQQQKQAEINAKNSGLTVSPEGAEIPAENSKRLLSTAITEFIEETKLTKKPKTLAAYTTALNYFTESCHKQYLEEIERKDLLKFSAFLRDGTQKAISSQLLEQVCHHNDFSQGE
jgi:hypothetical protein